MEDIYVYKTIGLLGIRIPFRRYGNVVNPPETVAISTNNGRWIRFLFREDSTGIPAWLFNVLFAAIAVFVFLFCMVLYHSGSLLFWPVLVTGIFMIYGLLETVFFDMAYFRKGYVRVTCVRKRKTLMGYILGMIFLVRYYYYIPSRHQQNIVISSVDQ